MQELLNRIRKGLSAGAYPNERAVSTSIVVPVLRALGWDDSDPSQVMPEYTTGRGKVDYALAYRPNSPAVFVEVKRVGQSADADRQLFEYAFHEGAQIAVLTDGRDWNFYLPGQHGSYEDRRVYQLAIDDRTDEEAIVRLNRYLSRSRVASGVALSDAQADYSDRASRRAAEAAMPRAWGELLSEPDGLLVDLLRERTEAICGFRPADESVERFVRSRLEPNEIVAHAVARRRENNGSESGKVSASSNTSAEAPAVAENSRAGARWRVGTLGRRERNQNEAFVALLTALFEQHPDRQAAMAAAVRTRGRNNIARIVEEIYPKRPEIGLKNNRALPDDWFVGTNESSGTKIKIVSSAVRAAGLTMGKDVEFEA